MDAALFEQCLRVWKSSGEALDEVWQASEHARARRREAGLEPLFVTESYRILAELEKAKFDPE
jgi:hypothetical protein